MIVITSRINSFITVIPKTASIRYVESCMRKNSVFNNDEFSFWEPEYLWAGTSVLNKILVVSFNAIIFLSIYDNKEKEKNWIQLKSLSPLFVTRGTHRDLS